MYWLMNAWLSTTSVMVFLRSAPTARTGRSAGIVATAPGAYPRARRKSSARADPRGHRVVDAACDWALADEKDIGDAREPVEGVVVLVRDGLARPIGAGHDQQRRRAGREQQVMQRRVGQHHAVVAVVRCHVRQCLRAGARTMGRAAEPAAPSPPVRAR